MVEVDDEDEEEEGENEEEEEEGPEALEEAELGAAMVDYAVEVDDNVGFNIEEIREVVRKRARKAKGRTHTQTNKPAAAAASSAAAATATPAGGIASSAKRSGGRK
jgi:hypothetical protein